MKITRTIAVTTRGVWRRWLASHHDGEAEIWLRYIAAALRRNPEADRFFRGLSPSYRRLYVGWIHSAKREETRQRRLSEAVSLLARGQKLGLK